MSLPSDLSPTDVEPDVFDPAVLEQSLAVIDRSMEKIRAGHGQDAREAVPEIAYDLGLALDCDRHKP